MNLCGVAALRVKSWVQLNSANGYAVCNSHRRRTFAEPRLRCSLACCTLARPWRQELPVRNSSMRDLSFVALFQ